MKAQKQLPQTSLFSGSTSSASALYVDLKFCVHVLLKHGLRRVYSSTNVFVARSTISAMDVLAQNLPP